MEVRITPRHRRSDIRKKRRRCTRPPRRRCLHSPVELPHHLRRRAHPRPFRKHQRPVRHLRISGNIAFREVQRNNAQFSKESHSWYVPRALPERSRQHSATQITTGMHSRKSTAAADTRTTPGGILRTFLPSFPMSVFSISRKRSSNDLIRSSD